MTSCRLPVTQYTAPSVVVRNAEYTAAGSGRLFLEAHPNPLSGTGAGREAADENEI